MTTKGNTSSIYELDVREDHGGWRKDDLGFWIFLLEDGVPVAYMNGRYGFSDFDKDSKVVALQSIEVRPGYRNQGLSKKLMEMVKTHFNVDSLEHSGGYTPDGAVFVAKYCVRPDGADEPRSYRPMKFIEDWDRKTLAYN